MAVVWHRAVRAWAGPNAVWRDDSADDDHELHRTVRFEPKPSAKTQEPTDRGAPPIGDLQDDAEGVRLEDFVAYMQTHDCIFKPAGDFWPAARVNARLPKIKLSDRNGQPVIDEKTGEQKEIRPSEWLAKHAPVEQMTWAPGLPQLIENKLISGGGWINRKA